MRDELRHWIADADTRGNAEIFALSELMPDLAYQEGRDSDLQSSLTGELFDLIRTGPADSRDWGTVANGFTRLGRRLQGPGRSDLLLYAAAAFYLGGFSASAYLTMRQATRDHLETDVYDACYDLLARPTAVRSEQVAELLDALRSGDQLTILQARDAAAEAVADARATGPDAWVSSVLLAALLQTFVATNVRAVLPNGEDRSWDPLVESFISRRPPVWDFFPSQRVAIEAGLLNHQETYSLQMPTGAGKTALTETLIFSHLNRQEGHDLAVVLVPFRSLGTELRTSLGENLTSLGYPTRTIYGGIVPSPEETDDLDAVRVIIATPESLTGLLDNTPELSDRLSMLVCDEGHLLDSKGGRGVGLELLLARFRAREEPPRIVFVSAIVPNIDEINAWLGGTDETVVRSDFRPADAEYAVLRPSKKTGRSLRINLRMHAPSDTNLPSRVLPGFLTADDFDYVNPANGRHRIWPNASIKAHAVAAARKSLLLGSVAVFATAKTGNQGVLSLAEELIAQRAAGLQLPDPADLMPEESQTRVSEVVEYLTQEYGPTWTGTLAVENGAVVHHGDIPQETREVLEGLLRGKHIRLVFCTSTLAEGVNLPIRTLVLYSTERMEGRTRVRMLTREIKNLVGRAGRAGTETKGLVICANPDSWAAVKAVADGASGERVNGALLTLIQEANRSTGTRLDNQLLETEESWLAVTDGIDATLLELLSDELGRDEFIELARELADSTFAYQLANNHARDNLEQVFTLRAQRLIALRANGRLSLSTGTGARARLLDSVLDDLLPRYDWTAAEAAIDGPLLRAILEWAWTQSEMRRSLIMSYPQPGRDPVLPPVDDLYDQLVPWLSGDTFAEIARRHKYDLDRILRIHAGVVSFTLATLVEQAIAVLVRYFEQTGEEIAPIMTLLPDFLRYGTSDTDARDLLANGMRHRRAAVLLGAEFVHDLDTFLLTPTEQAARIIEADSDRWHETLGSFVFARTVNDVGAVLA
ncbi:Helicase conserved C-terminal domain-containing protein [Nocardioides sp. YR527]|uniref:DEAD/DEAH box helicase n=1 Tax=Nocardioides sp. YR527 TaxID=1881028 RepID=UPI00088A1B10|nr:DEAD/DEAH box helicase [Nocardioides sp. YR527]SDK49282.1 Helicase conserved C-terminal domain-containing protein [Nocardioides sp. YR527]